MLKLPAVSVVTVRTKLLTGLRTSTVAPETTAPDGSVTVPLMHEGMPPISAPNATEQNMARRTVIFVPRLKRFRIAWRQNDRADGDQRNIESSLFRLGVNAAGADVQSARCCN